MLTHEELLNKIADEKKFTFISTGMSTEKEIDKAVKIFKDKKVAHIHYCIVIQHILVH